MELRKATIDDAVDLLKWKNDPLTRKNALLTDEVILWENHIKWLTEKLSDKNTELYVVVEDGNKLGDVRFDIGGEIEVSVRVNPLHRSQGVASRAVGLGCKAIKTRINKPLVAKILVDNIPSLRVFLKNGFLPSEYRLKPKGHYILRRP